MNTISHKQAREWIQVRLDGQLDKASDSALNIHLQDCAACRLYAVGSERLDSELKQAYRERVHMQHSVLSRPLSTSTDKQMRLKMRNKQIMNVVTSLALLAIMTVAILGFSWIVSTRGKVIWPAAENQPTPTLTPPPFPWTESHPLTSVEQIQTNLDALAQKTINVIQGAAWVHIVRTDMADQPGMTHSTYLESWAHYPKDNHTCTEFLTLSKDHPESSNDFLQIQVGLPDGTFGDLVLLRNGSTPVKRFEPDSADCSLSPKNTPAGQLSTRLGQEHVDVKAWYSEQDGQIVFNVTATFTQPSQTNPGVTKETRSFDMETGMEVQEHIRMEWKDGSVFSETLQGYKTDFLPELPAKVAAQYAQFSAELKSYADRAVPQPLDYTVRAGDTCLGIALSHGVSVQSIIAANNLSSVCILSVGQQIKIPYPTPTPASSLTDIPNAAVQTMKACETQAYTVQADDTLASISVNYNVPQEAIKYYNGLSTDTIFIGQSLIIPLCEQSAAPEPAATLTPTEP